MRTWDNIKVKKKHFNRRTMLVKNECHMSEILYDFHSYIREYLGDAEPILRNCLDHPGILFITI